MPMSAKKPCGQHGCRALVSETRYCPAHAKPAAKAQYQRDRIARPHRAMYGSARWKRLRAIVLSDQPFCSDGSICDPDKTGHRDVSTDVHHIVDVADNADLAWELTNLAALCHRCHAAITRSRTQSEAA
jgi:5-methylcytosine-specific restriction endonuclease McrA